MPKGQPLHWDQQVLLQLAERDDINTGRRLAVEYGKETGQVISASNVANYLARCDEEYATKVRAHLPGRQAAGPEREPTRQMREGATIKGDTATVVTKPAADLGDIDEALGARGLNPDEWQVDKVIVNEWESNAGEGQVITLRQLKIFLTRLVPIEFIVPPSDVKARKPSKARKATGQPRTVVLLPDQHAPYEDKGLHDRLVAFLADPRVHIDEVGLLGDVLDLPTVSRHRDNPAWAASVNECLQRGFELLRDYTQAAGPDVKFWKLKGNHDVRLETELLSRAERMFGIRPASVDGEDQDHALSLRRLLHLEALRIDLVEPARDGDNYDQAWREITPSLEARHGWLSGSKSADKMLARVNRNLVVGHTHRQHLTRRTTWVGSHHQTIECLEAGTLRGIEGGGGFAVAPDWQQGFVVAQIVEGRPVLDFARYDENVLRWRDMTW